MNYQQKSQLDRSTEDIRRIRELEDAIRKAKRYLNMATELISLLDEELSNCELPF